jgi:hypothetical protein
VLRLTVPNGRAPGPASSGRAAPREHESGNHGKNGKNGKNGNHGKGESTVASLHCDGPWSSPLLP